MAIRKDFPWETKVKGAKNHQKPLQNATNKNLKQLPALRNLFLGIIMVISSWVYPVYVSPQFGHAAEPSEVRNSLMSA